MSGRKKKTAQELSEEYSFESLDMASSLLRQLEENGIKPTPEIIKALNIFYEWFLEHIK